MDGESAENAGAFFSLAKNVRRGISRAKLAPTKIIEIQVFLPDPQIAVCV